MKNKILMLILIVVIMATGFLYLKNMSSGEKKLKYVQATNAGLLGYFDDGSVTACAKCDFTQLNINSLYKMKSLRSWDKNKTPESFDEDQNNPYSKSEWVIIDYKWVTPPESDTN